MAPSAVDIGDELKDRVAVTVTSGPYVLVRPDGYVAWAGSDAGQMRQALTVWCDGAR